LTAFDCFDQETSSFFHVIESSIMKPSIESYQNHILHCSVYMAVAAYAFQLLSVPFTSAWQILPLLLGGFAALNLYYEIAYMIWRIDLPPGDSGGPLFGNMLQVVGRGPRAMKLDLFRKYQSPLVTINLLMIPAVLVKDDEDVRWWLIQERKGGSVIPQLMPHLMKLLGPEAIMMQHSASHRRLRKIFEPSFSPLAVRGYAETIDATTQAELKKWCAKDDFCSSKDWAILAMRLFFVCAFGKVEEALLEKLSRSFHTWSEGFSSKIPFVLPGSKLQKAYVARAEMLQILQNMVNDFKKTNPPGSPGADNSMLGRLCYGVDEDGKPLSDSQLTCNILFILFAGHDTTKGSFCAFAYYLTEHPKIKSILLEEAKTFSEPLDVDELKAAPLLNAFLAETWRLVPPLSSHNLRTITDIEYKGYKLRKDTLVCLDIHAFNVMDEDRYPDPWEFRLDRWLPKDHPLHNPKYFQEGVDYNVPSTKYRAFGMGGHMCLGAHFAKLEARVALTRLLQQYEIEIRNNGLIVMPLLQYNNDFKITRR
jgi:cytochrome P450